MSETERLARINENIYWLNRAHFMAAKKHEQRIQELMRVDEKEEIQPNRRDVFRAVGERFIPEDNQSIKKEG